MSESWTCIYCDSRSKDQFPSMISILKFKRLFNFVMYVTMKLKKYDVCDLENKSYKNGKILRANRRLPVLMHGQYANRTLRVQCSRKHT